MQRSIYPVAIFVRKPRACGRSDIAMNMFGKFDAGNGSQTLTRRIMIVCAAVAVGGLALAAILDRTTGDNAAWVVAPDASGALHALHRAPRAEAPVAGIRYGEVDYLPTASIPQTRQGDLRQGRVNQERRPQDRGSQDALRWKNVVTDPSLGLPPGFPR